MEINNGNSNGKYEEKDEEESNISSSSNTNRNTLYKFKKETPSRKEPSGKTRSNIKVKREIRKDLIWRKP